MSSAIIDHKYACFFQDTNAFVWEFNIIHARHWSKLLKHRSFYTETFSSKDEDSLKVLSIG